MVHELVVVVHPPPPVTVYPVTGEPPSAGAAQRTTTEPSPADAETVVGADGTVAAKLAILEMPLYPPKYNVPLGANTMSWIV